MTMIAITDEQIEALRTEAATAGDEAQRVVCDIALYGEDGETDHSGVWPEREYAGVQRTAQSDTGVRWALRLTSAEARAECARVIHDAAARD